jgi:nucleotide-binding universal stress UspA family protein
MIVVNFNSADHSLLAYASHIAKLAQSSKIYFVHFAEKLEIPSEIREQYPSLIEPLDEYAIRQMEYLAMQYFTDHKDLQMNFEVDDGDQVNSMLRLIKIKDIDLVLVGKNSNTPNDYYLGEKLARKAPCSVLVIPNGANPVYSNIVVASDFSNHSLDAMDVGHAFAGSAGIKSIDLLHVFDIPSGYYKTGKSYQQFSDIMKSNAKKEFEELMKNLNMNGVSSDLKLALDGKPARAIDKYIRSANSDLLIMGARGRANGAGILLGSVSEKLIRTVDIPLLAVKKKGAGLDILNAILNK